MIISVRLDWDRAAREALGHKLGLGRPASNAEIKRWVSVEVDAHISLLIREHEDDKRGDAEQD